MERAFFFIIIFRPTPIYSGYPEQSQIVALDYPDKPGSNGSLGVFFKTSELLPR